MRNRVGLLLISIAISGCGLADSRLEARARSMVVEKLSDPNSALFSKVVVVPDRFVKGTKNVCGYINAKNALGGYTGKKRFYVSQVASGDWDVSVDEGTPRDRCLFDVFWNDRCDVHGRDDVSLSNCVGL